MQLKEICKSFVNGVHKVSNVFAWISGGSLLAMAVLTFCDVGFRYFVNRPIKGSQEIIELMMVFVVYMGLPQATFKRQHIVVDALVNVFAKRVQFVLYGLGSLLCLLVSAPTAVNMLGRGIEIFNQSNIATGTLGIPLGPFYILASAGCFILSLEFLFDGILRFMEAVRMGSGKAASAQA